MTNGYGGRSDDGLEIVCPTCDGILEVDGSDGVVPGDAIRAFCPTCTQDVEVTAPPGVSTSVNGQVDRVQPATISEFTSPRGVDPR